MSVGKYVKMSVVGLVVAVGGPMFVHSIRPSDEELFNKYSPELQKEALANRSRREKEYNDYVNRLKEWSKSDKAIWFVARDEEARRNAEAYAPSHRTKEDERIQREEMRRELQEGK